MSDFDMETIDFGIKTVDENKRVLKMWLDFEAMKVNADTYTAYKKVVNAAYYASGGGIVGFGAKDAYDASAKAAYEEGGVAPYNFIGYYFWFAFGKALDADADYACEAYLAASNAVYAEADAVKHKL